ncbi:hypothetical protein EGW08_016374 [Elysia chlorotica]|uniref:PHD-type domain-containing protein n=1 Tax=Elysia chlorotica TaxID=188477 RepID=A0A433T2S1_ELYCH|nr:hypothetical protein EGW08_016374 [Elysia chlorotica]
MSTERNNTSSSRSSKKENTACGKCDKEVGRKDPALKCDMCEIWHHTNCEAVPDSFYKAIQETGQGASQGLHWYCRKCNKFATRFMAGLNSLSLRQDALEEKVKGIENQAEATNNSVAEMAKGKLPSGMLGTVKEVAKEAQEETRNRIWRGRNLLIFGLDEPEHKDRDMRATEDNRRVKDLLGFSQDNALPKEIRRIGNYDAEKCRPLRVAYATENDRDDTLRNFRKAKKTEETAKDTPKPLQKISMRRDMTPTERKEEADLFAALKKKQEESKKMGDDRALWIRRGGRIVNLANYADHPPPRGEQ